MAVNLQEKVQMNRDVISYIEHSLRVRDRDKPAPQRAV